MTRPHAGCVQPLPAPLRNICADSRAFAPEVNANTQQFVDWLVPTVGPVVAPARISGRLSLDGDVASTSRTLRYIDSASVTPVAGGTSIGNDNAAQQARVLAWNASGGGLVASPCSTASARSPPPSWAPFSAER